jgi:GntR family transcriptional regulator/MocR family aminotransferase
MQHSSVNPQGRGRALYEEIKVHIVDGTYAAGMLLPSTRACAAERGLSRTTVSAVYEQLAAEGYIETRPGSASRVAQGAMAPRSRAAFRRPSHLPAKTQGSRIRLSVVGERISRLVLPSMEVPPADVIDFVYGPLAGLDFPTLAWMKASRRIERVRPARLAYDDPRGDLGLRRALQAYLARAKGLSCDVEQLVIVNGSQQAIDLCARLLLNPGDTAVVENPGYRMAHHVFEAVGATLHGIDVDQQGLRTEELEKVSDARLVFVTPTHQFPLGAFLTVSRRNALLQWAAKQDAWVIEDDYDSEYRFGVRPEASLQSMDNRALVVHVGTFSKTLSPQLRLGYMVLPLRLAATFAAAKRLADRHAPSAGQRTLAGLLESGVYERHVRRIRRMQHARQSALLTSLQRHLPDRVTVQGAASGLHVVAWVNDLPYAQEEALVVAARRERVRVYPLSPFYVADPHIANKRRPAGLVLGYALLAPEQIEIGVRRLSSALRRLSPHAAPGGPAREAAQH